MLLIVAHHGFSPNSLLSKWQSRISPDGRIVTPCDPNVTQFTRCLEGPVKAKREDDGCVSLFRSCHEARQMPICNHWFLSGHYPLMLHCVRPARRCANREFSMQIRVLAFISIF